VKPYVTGSLKLIVGGVALILVVGLTAAVLARPAATENPGAGQTVAVEVTARGFVPETLELVAGATAELVFTRTTGSGCAAQIHIPDLGVERTPLPQGEPVTVRIIPTTPGTYEILCGMNMFRGTIVVKSAD